MNIIIIFDKIIINMLVMKKIVLILLLSLSFSFLFSQAKFMVGDNYSDEPINPDAFNQQLFQKVLMHGLNNYLENRNIEKFEPHSFFELASRQYAIIMAETENARLISDERGYETVSDRLESAGGTGIGSQVVHRANAIVDNRMITYQELADECIFRWTSSARDLEDLIAQKYFFAGVYAQFDERQRRIYVSLYIGNYASLLTEIDDELMDGLATPIPTRVSALDNYNDDVCGRALRRLDNFIDMQKGLYVNDVGEIIFEFDDLRTMQRFLRERRDGLGVDIVQKSQFNDCRIKNIVDFSQPNIGIVNHEWSSNIFRNNIAPADGPRDRVTGLKVVLGNFPENLRVEDTELNLLLIQDRYVCANIPPSYVDKKVYDYTQNTNILPDTIIPKGVPVYSASSTESEFKFQVLFEQGQHVIDNQDIRSIVNVINEPDLNVNRIYITAYSSVEGSQSDNIELQNRRALSIKTEILKHIDEIEIETKAKTNLEGLKSDIKGTEYDHLLELSDEEIIDLVNKNPDKYEKFLKKHRYADVVLVVNFNMAGDNVQRFVLNDFNSAIQAGNLNRALSIQKYILKQITRNKFDSHAVSDMRIPAGKEYVGLNMNKLWLTQFIFMDPLNESYCKQIDDLHELDPSNHFVRFNKLVCEIEYADYNDYATIESLQRRVDYMYNTRISEYHVDRLNIHLQNKKIDYYLAESGYDHPQLNSSLNKIKDIINFDDISWQNSLKLAGVFTNIGEYDYALNLLEPWINEDNVSINLIKSYIFLCTKIEYRTHSRRFYQALERLNEHNTNEFCNLFRRDGKLSVQTFVNTDVKELYCKHCK